MVQLVDGAAEYELARCPMPACKETLFLAVTGHQDIYSSFGPADFELEALGLDMPHWVVRCLAGHVLLLPPDDGAEGHEFGKCTTHDLEAGDEHGANCGGFDFERLRLLLAALS